MKELSSNEISRQDFVDKNIYELINTLNLSAKHIEWNIEMIADVRDRIEYWLINQYKVSDGQSFYPFIPE
jgi:hypothetical protein